MLALHDPSEQLNETWSTTLDSSTLFGTFHEQLKPTWGTNMHKFLHMIGQIHPINPTAMINF